ncbi:MAG: ATP-dependent DNA ligase LigA [Halobacteriales archaeon]
MEFAAFAQRAADIEAETADLEIIAGVSALFEEAESALPIVARFVQGRVFPAWSSKSLDIGPNLCYAALARAAGPVISVEDIENRLAEVGDVGAVAADLDLGGQQGLGAFGEGSQELSVADVYEEFQGIAAATGAGSQDRKLEGLFGMFTRCSPAEARYIARIVLGEMRIGVGEGTVRDAIADAFGVSTEQVERALMVSNDCGLVAETARDQGVAGLTDIQLELGRPVKSMLAQAGTIEDAFDDWEDAVVQIKYDGARVQSHYDGEATRVFSRNMEDVTEALPEIVEFVEANAREPAILDGEVVAIDADGEPLPFQQVLRRFRRKHDVEQTREAVELEVQFFDCLHRDGTDLIDEPLARRHSALAEVLDAGIAAHERCPSPEDARRVEAEAIADGHEGVMLKDPTSPYRPGRRGQRWLKVKPAVETLDCVVTGAEWGEGRRANLLGTYELSVRSEDGLMTVGNVATGFTDADLERLTDRLEAHVTARSGQQVELEPAVVFEIGYAEIQTSPTYDSGYALRFPRFIAVREDQSPADADTLERVEALAGQSVENSAESK